MNIIIDNVNSVIIKLTIVKLIMFIEVRMEITDRIRNLVEVFRVANDDVIGNTARQVFNLNWKEGLSARNQAHKILDELALTNHIKKGKGFYAVKEYQGEYKEHDRKVTECITQLILLGYPLTLFHEVSLPLGLRADLIGIMGRNGKGLVFWLEVCVKEDDSYFAQKETAIRNNRPAITEALTQLFGVKIPDFMFVVCGKQHSNVISFDKFMEEVK